jgi:hypothetical protein
MAQLVYNRSLGMELRELTAERDEILEEVKRIGTHVGGLRCGWLSRFSRHTTAPSSPSDGSSAAPLDAMQVLSREGAHGRTGSAARAQAAVAARRRLFEVERRVQEVIVEMAAQSVKASQLEIDWETDKYLADNGLAGGDGVPQSGAGGGGAAACRLSANSRWSSMQRTAPLAAQKAREAAETVAEMEERAEEARLHRLRHANRMQIAMPTILLALVLVGCGGAGAILSVWARPDGEIEPPWVFSFGIAMVLSVGVLEPLLVLITYGRSLSRETRRYGADREALALVTNAERQARADDLHARVISRFGAKAGGGWSGERRISFAGDAPEEGGSVAHRAEELPPSQQQPARIDLRFSGRRNSALVGMRAGRDPTSPEHRAGRRASFSCSPAERESFSGAPVVPLAPPPPMARADGVEGGAGRCNDARGVARESMLEDETLFSHSDDEPSDIASLSDYASPQPSLELSDQSRSSLSFSSFSENEPREMRRRPRDRSRRRQRRRRSRSRDDEYEYDSANHFSGYSDSGAGSGAYGGSAYGGSAYGGSAYGDSAYGESAYGESAYGDSAYGGSAYGGSTYGGSAYGGSAYGDSAYGGSAYGESAYGSGAYGGSAYGGSAYGESAYGDSAYGGSAYGGSTYGEYSGCSDSGAGSGAYGESAYGGSAYGGSAYGGSAYGDSAYGGSAYGEYSGCSDYGGVRHGAYSCPPQDGDNASEGGHSDYDGDSHYRSHSADRGGRSSADSYSDDGNGRGVRSSAQGRRRRTNRQHQLPRINSVAEEEQDAPATGREASHGYGAQGHGGSELRA